MLISADVFFIPPKLFKLRFDHIRLLFKIFIKSISSNYGHKAKKKLSCQKKAAVNSMVILFIYL